MRMDFSAQEGSIDVYQLHVECSKNDGLMNSH